MATAVNETPGSPRLLIQGLHHRYALHAVLEDINLEIKAGQTTAVVGPSGCGKTTLLRLCARLTTLREGKIDNRFSRTACVFQEACLLPWKHSLANIALGLKALGIHSRQRKQCATQMGLAMGLSAEDLTKFPQQLSGGMQSRVALARALVVEPELMLLDEPFSALDIGLKLELYALLLQEQARRGLAIMLITHDLMEAVRLSSHIVVLSPQPGRIACRLELPLAIGERDDSFVFHTTAALLQEEAVRHAFDLPEQAASPSSVSHNGGYILSTPSARQSAHHGSSPC